MTHLNDTYNTLPKQDWRNYVYSMLDLHSCNTLVDENNNIIYKWAELVGADALTFKQLLSTNRITESQLIGISRDSSIIKSCKPLYPESEFYCTEWNSFCNTYPNNDIGVFILDGFYAAHGKDLKIVLKNTLKIVKRCKDAIGEVLLVINVDGNMSYRLHSKKNNITIRETLKTSLEECFEQYGEGSIKNTIVDVNSMYEYKQSKQNTTMLSCGILF